MIIVCKQSRNPEDDAQGALGAAKQYNPNAGKKLQLNTKLGSQLSRENFTNFVYFIGCDKQIYFLHIFLKFLLRIKRKTQVSIAV